MKHPLLVLTLIFVLGIAVADQLRVPFQLLYILLVIVFIFELLLYPSKNISVIFSLIFIFLLGAACLRNSYILPKSHLLRLIPYKSEKLYLIRGMVVSSSQFKDNCTTFIFKAEELAEENLSRRCSGNIIVYLKGKVNFFYGDELFLRGNLHRPFYSRTLNRTSYRDYLANQNIYFIMRVKTDFGVLKLNVNQGLWLKRFSLQLKNKIEKVLYRQVSFIAAGILDAMILGEKRNIPYFVADMMMKSGTVHILVVSGFNVGIVSFVALLFLKLLRVPRRARFCIVIIFLVIYCLMTGASNPVVRATIMGIIFIGAYLIKRDADIYNSLSLAALFILLINPRQLFDLGFQLSFSSVVAIIYLYPRFKKILNIAALKNRFLLFLSEGVLVSLAAWLGTVGIIAYNFRIFSPVTILANLFVVPLATLITLSGFSMVIASLISPILAHPFALSSELLVALLLKANSALVNLPFAYLYF